MSSSASIENSRDAIALDQTIKATHQATLAPAELPTPQKFPLLDLAPALRSRVYKHLISAGDLSVLRTSKLVHREAVPYLSQVACFRLGLGSPNQSPVTLDLKTSITSLGQLTLTAPDYIQHVSININQTPGAGRTVDPHLIRCFGGNSITRKSCVITVTLGNCAALPQYTPGDETYGAIAALTGFKVLRLHFDREPAPEDNEFTLRVLGRVALQATDINIFRRLFWDSCRKIEFFLEKTLGYATVQGEDCQYSLVFWPSEYQVKRAGK